MPWKLISKGLVINNRCLRQYKDRQGRCTYPSMVGTPCYFAVNTNTSLLILLTHLPFLNSETIPIAVTSSRNEALNTIPSRLYTLTLTTYSEQVGSLPVFNHSEPPVQQPNHPPPK